MRVLVDPRRRGGPADNRSHRCADGDHDLCSGAIGAGDRRDAVVIHPCACECGCSSDVDLEAVAATVRERAGA